MKSFKKAVIEHRETDIIALLDKVRQEEVIRNQTYLKSTAETVLLSARQNIPLRGHRNETGRITSDGKEPEETEGNLRALLRFWIRAGDQPLAECINKSKKNATYQS